MTKWENVQLWVQNKEFTRKDFNREFGEYPNCESNYLKLLINRNLVERTGRGKFKCDEFKINHISSGGTLKSKAC